MGKYGRPRLPEGERRDAGALHVRLNSDERRVVDEKASAAGVTPHEWARLAALERDPPKRIIPELNHEAWLQTARQVDALEQVVRRFGPGDEASVMAAVESVRQELRAVRKLFIGEAS